MGFPVFSSPQVKAGPLGGGWPYRLYVLLKKSYRSESILGGATRSPLKSGNLHIHSFKFPDFNSDRRGYSHYLALEVFMSFPFRG